MWKKNPTKEQIKEYKMTEREIYEKHGNLSEDEFRKSNKTVYVANGVMTNVIKRCRGEKKRGVRKIDGCRKKLMIPESEIPECPEFEVKSIIGNIFVNEKMLEEYSVKLYKIDPYFYEHHKEKMKIDKNGRKYILFRIDVYFTEYSLGVEIDEKGHNGREQTRGEKTKSNRKKLGCEFIRINTSKCYDEGYKIGRIQTFPRKFKDRQLKKRKRIK